MLRRVLCMLGALGMFVTVGAQQSRLDLLVNSADARDGTWFRVEGPLTCRDIEGRDVSPTTAERR